MTKAFNSNYLLKYFAWLVTKKGIKIFFTKRIYVAYFCFEY